MAQSIVISPGTKIKLKDYDPNYTGEYQQRKDAEKILVGIKSQMIELQELLYAENKRALLIILQAMDTAGKDDPQGCDVESFKVPTPEELSHDFLWRAHKVVPGKGKIVIFNRSYYEDVLVVRVHNLVPKEVWTKRYEHINGFEKCLIENNTMILKFFLHISKDEQKKRIEQRLEDPAKKWKFSEADLKEREYWDDYMDAYENVLTKCSTEYAPWHIIPANKKWYRNLVIGEIIVNALKEQNMKFPEPKIDLSKIKIE
jgi:PPK2 family polyphosphate:nucleotide phosphotransferase